MTTTTSSSEPSFTVMDSGRSFWARIANELAQAIGQGLYAPGERLPSEHSLAQQFGVNRHTIRRSLASLGQQGLVRSTQGSGTYVEDFAVDLVLGKRTRHRQSLSQAGLRGSLQVLHAQELRADAGQARALRVRVGSRLLHLTVLGEGAGQPLHVSERYFPLPRFTGLDNYLVETGSITQAFAMLGVADYTRLSSRISARMPEADVAAWLRQPVARPALQVTSVNIDAEGLPIEYACTWFAGDRVTLTVEHDDAA